MTQPTHDIAEKVTELRNYLTAQRTRLYSDSGRAFNLAILTGAVHIGTQVAVNYIINDPSAPVAEHVPAVMGMMYPIMNAVLWVSDFLSVANLSAKAGAYLVTKYYSDMLENRFK